jgi:adenine/guanine/hypoxanthine permease
MTTDFKSSFLLRLSTQLETRFKLKEHKTTIARECLAGLTTFLTMAYICLLVPSILGEVGMPASAVFVSTCLVTALGCFLMAGIANYPIAIAPSMGLLAYFAYVVVKTLGFSWHQALAAVLIAGAVFLVLTIFKIRQWIIESIPYSLSMAIAVGIGLFIGFIALREAGIIVNDQNTLVTLGDLRSHTVLLSLAGFCVIAVLDFKNIPGAIILGMFGVSLCGYFLGDVDFSGIISLPPSVAPIFNQIDFQGVFNHQGIIVIFTFFLVALFDSTGTLLGVLHQAGMFNNIKRNKRIPKALLAESITATVGAVMGVPTTSPYIESAAGIQAGGRTGLTAVMVGICFLACLFFSPLALAIPSYATAPALLFVACLMIRGMMAIDWNDLTEGIPAAITIIMIPFTFSIANGIGFGFISYVVIKILSGKFQNISFFLVFLAAVFCVYFFLNNQLTYHHIALPANTLENYPLT